MIEFDENIVGIWFTNVPGGDWLAAVSEVEADTKYKLMYRFRYYKDDKVFEDSEDVKNWFKAGLTGTRSYVIAAMHTVAKELAAVSDQKLYELLNDYRDLERFLREFQKMPFAFARMEKKHEQS